jgi:dihydrodipicolinate synthase/N-acetylneuraminate lyase
MARPTPAPLRERLHGVVPPAVTPLTAEGRLDADGLAALVEHLVNGGVHGLFMMGTTGEAYVLPDAVRREAVARAAEFLRGRLPLYVGIGDSSVERTLANAEHAAAAGADALVLISPPYLDYSEAERVGYFSSMAERLPRPMLVYNIPQVNKNPVTPAMLRELVGVPGIVGLKDSAGDAMRSSEVLAWLRAEHPDFRWFEGHDTLAAQSLAIGAHGIVNGGSNVFPRLYVALWDAAQRGDAAALRAAHGQLLRALELFALDRGNSSAFGSFLKCCKHALSVLGIGQGHLSPTFAPLGAASRRAVERMLAGLAE